MLVSKSTIDLQVLSGREPFSQIPFLRSAKRNIFHGHFSQNLRKGTKRAFLQVHVPFRRLYHLLMSQNNNFNPMQWIAEVYKLGEKCPPIEGTLTGLQSESHRFRKNVVNKLPYMRQNFSHMFPINEIESKVLARENALSQSLESLQDFLQTCQNIEHDLADSERKLASVGELSIFPAGIQPQVMKLGHIETTMNCMENTINQCEPIFYVAVTNAHNAELQGKRTELRRKFDMLKDKLKYQQQKAAENQRISEEYQETNRQIRHERNEIFTLINTFVGSRMNNNSRREIIEVLRVIFFSNS